VFDGDSQIALFHSAAPGGDAWMEQANVRFASAVRVA
jgi:hypothetical protein